MKPHSQPPQKTALVKIDPASMHSNARFNTLARSSPWISSPLTISRQNSKAADISCSTNRLGHRAIKNPAGSEHVLERSRCRNGHSHRRQVVNGVTKVGGVKLGVDDGVVVLELQVFKAGPVAALKRA